MYDKMQSEGMIQNAVHCKSSEAYHRLKAGEKEFNFVKLPPFILEIFNDGGLLPHTKRKLDKKG